MSTFCFLAGAASSLTPTQAHALRYLGDVPLGRVANGDLPAYRDPQGRVWLIAQDARFSLLRGAVVGRCLATLPQFPDFDPLELTPEEIRTECERYAAERGLVRPEDVPDLDLSDDPWAAVLAANGAPPVVRILGGIPADWVPVEG